MRSGRSIVAILATMALAIGFVVVVFVLPASVGEGGPALQRAVQRTLDAPSYHLSMVTSSGTVQTEDFVAPDRLRMTTTAHGETRVAMLVVGDHAYSHWSCGPDGTSGYTESKFANGLRLSATNSLKYLLDHATDVRRSGSSEDGEHFTFTPARIASANPAIKVHFAEGTALVADGRLRHVTLRGSFTADGKTATGGRASDSAMGTSTPSRLPPPNKSSRGAIPAAVSSRST